MREDLLLDQISQLRAENAELARRLAICEHQISNAHDCLIDGFPLAALRALKQALDNH